MFNGICFTVCFIGGIVLMGSDGLYFPVLNLFGAILFAGCIYFAKEV